MSFDDFFGLSENEMKEANEDYQKFVSDIEIRIVNYLNELSIKQDGINKSIILLNNKIKILDDAGKEVEGKINNFLLAERLNIKSQADYNKFKLELEAIKTKAEEEKQLFINLSNKSKEDINNIIILKKTELDALTKKEEEEFKKDLTGKTEKIKTWIIAALKEFKENLIMMQNKAKKEIIKTTAEEDKQDININNTDEENSAEDISDVQDDEPDDTEEESSIDVLDFN